MSILSALTFDSKRVSREGLKRLNLVVAVILLIEAILAFILRGSVSGAHSVQLSYLSKDDIVSKAAGQDILLSASRHLFDINILYLVVIIFVIGAVGHALVSTTWKQKYDQQLDRSINYFRWNTYCFTASLLILSAALFDGVGEIMLLVGVALSVAALMLGAKTQESITSRTSRSIWAIKAMLPLILIPVLAMIAALYGSYVYGTTTNIYQYIVLLLALIYLVWLCMFSLRATPVAKDYLRRERTYILTNLVGLSLVGWLIVVGSLK